MKRLWLVGAAALTLGFVQAAAAAEIEVISIPGVKAALTQLVPQFERQSGNKVTIHFEIYAGQKNAVDAGNFDVAIFGKSQIAEMDKLGKIAPNSTTDLARTSIGVVVRKGAPKPDIHD